RGREHVGAEVFHDGVALGNQAFDDFNAFGVARVEADRELAVMQRVEVRVGVELLLALHIVRLRRIGGEAAVRRETMIVPAAGALDVDHLRTVMREQPRCPWPDGFPGEIEHTDAAQPALVPMGGFVCRRFRGMIGRLLIHLIAPAAASAAMSCSVSPRSCVSTWRVCSPKWGARPRGSICSASHANGPRGYGIACPICGCSMLRQ